MLLILLDNVRSAYNVGSAFRTADGAGVDGLILTGFSPYPPHKKLSKTALGAEDLVPWLYCVDPLAALTGLQSGQLTGDAHSANWPTADVAEHRFSISCFETGESVTSLFETRFEEHTLLVFGHEVTGIHPDLLQRSDHIVEIPQYGQKASLNMASAFAVGVYEYRRQMANQSAD